MSENNTIPVATLTLLHYKRRFIPLAFVSMALFRLPLMLHKPLRFWRLMGSGKNGTFDKIPDLQQWALLGVYHPDFFEHNNKDHFLKQAYGRFIYHWIKLLGIKTHTYLLQPLESHGLWNGKRVFGELPRNTPYEGKIAVLTRATIRLSKLGRFWEHVPNAATEMAQAEGFITSYGVGEWPWVKQATFSLWTSKEAMRKFAYKSTYHKEVVQKTHREQWYSEEMFTRFRVLRELKF
jgi:hypothetical protein